MSLRRCLLVLSLASGLLLSACGDGTPGIEVTPGEHDFGRVMQGQTRETTFTITNHTDRPVGFKAVPNCSCFAAAHALRTLDPGQSQPFRVLFDTTKLMGLIKGKWITLHTEHPDFPTVVVPLEGEIYRAFSVSPPRFLIGRIDGRPANYEPRTIRVRPESGYTVRLERAVSVPLKVLRCETVAAPSGGFDVRVSIPRDIRRPIGPFRAKVRLELALEAPDGKEMRQSAYVGFEGFWSLQP